MGVSVLVLGVSGTGKSASLRNFEKDEIALVNVAGKPLPFKGKFKETLNSDDYSKIKDFIKRTDKQSIVIDDAQYLMGNEFMRRALEKGYDKFTELAKNFFELLTFIQSLPEGKIVYLLGHIERDQDGNEKFKTMGKLIDQCINVEGTCTIVLKTCVSDGNYNFLTQNSGKDTVKSPMGMFPSFAIDNDLKYVDDKIRNYYEYDGAVSDEEMAEKDTAAATEMTAEEVGGKKKRSRRKADEQPKENSTPATQPDFMNIPDGVDEEVPFDEVVPDEQPKSGRRSRHTKAEPDAGICQADTYFYIESDDNYVMKHKGDAIPEGAKEISKEEFGEGVKRLATVGNPADEESADGGETPKREPEEREDNHMGINILLGGFSIILFWGMICDHDRENRKNFMYGFLICVVAITVLNL